MTSKHMNINTDIAKEKMLTDEDSIWLMLRLGYCRCTQDVHLDHRQTVSVILLVTSQPRLLHCFSKVVHVLYTIHT